MSVRAIWLVGKSFASAQEARAWLETQAKTPEERARWWILKYDLQVRSPAEVEGILQPEEG